MPILVVYNDRSSIFILPLSPSTPNVVYTTLSEVYSIEFTHATTLLSLVTMYTMLHACMYNTRGLRTHKGSSLRVELGTANRTHLLELTDFGRPKPSLHLFCSGVHLLFLLWFAMFNFRVLFRRRHRQAPIARLSPLDVLVASCLFLPISAHRWIHSPPDQRQREDGVTSDPIWPFPYIPYSILCIWYCTMYIAKPRTPVTVVERGKSYARRPHCWLTSYLTSSCFCALF